MYNEGKKHHLYMDKTYPMEVSNQEETKQLTPPCSPRPTPDAHQQK